jgi:transcriptional regulatory protein LevR
VSRLAEQTCHPAAAALLLPLLSCAFHTLAGEDDPIQGIIVSHGRATASSIAGIANQLTGGYYFKAFDMANATSTRRLSTC